MSLLRPCLLVRVIFGIVIKKNTRIGALLLIFSIPSCCYYSSCAFLLLGFIEYYESAWDLGVMWRQLHFSKNVNEMERMPTSLSFPPSMQRIIFESGKSWEEVTNFSSRNQWAGCSKLFVQRLGSSSMVCFRSNNCEISNVHNRNFNWKGWKCFTLNLKYLSRPTTERPNVWSLNNFNGRHLVETANQDLSILLPPSKAWFFISILSSSIKHTWKPAVGSLH